MHTFFISLWNLVLEMAPYLLFGFFVAGILHAFVPQRIFRQTMSRPGFGSVMAATLLGIPLPLCSCGVIPTTVSLRRSGASSGACTAFLIATPQTGVDSILVTYSLLGLPFAIIRPLAALVTGIIGGIATDMTACNDEKSFFNKQKTSEADNASRSFAARSREAIAYAYGELLEDVGRWLLVGLIIAGLITAFVPTGFFLSLRAYPLLNMLIVLAVAIPMYVCATGSIPIAMALMAAGMTPGSALVLLMAGPAVNAASLLVVGKALGHRNMIAYLMSVIAGAVAFGLAIDYLLPAEWFDVASKSMHLCCGGHDAEWWETAASLLFIAFLARALWHRQFHHGHCHCNNNCDSSCEHQQECNDNNSCAGNNTFVLQVEGMRCSHCAAAVERAVKESADVEAVAIDLPTGNVSITGNAASRDCIITAITSVGYRVKEQESPK